MLATATLGAGNPGVKRPLKSFHPMGTEDLLRAPSCSVGPAVSEASPTEDVLGGKDP